MCQYANAIAFFHWHIIPLGYYFPESLNSNTIMTEQITFPEKGHINNWQTIIN